MHDRLAATILAVLALVVPTAAETTSPFSMRPDETPGDLSLPRLDRTPRGRGAVPERVAATAKEVAGREHAIDTRGRDGVVRLWLRSNDPQVQLLGKNAPVSAGSRTTRDVICQAPCGVLVDGSAGTEFQFGGPDLVSSSKFRLLGRQGDLTATVAPGSSKARALAPILGGLGVSILVGGFLVEEDAVQIGGVVVGTGLLVGAYGVFRASRTTYSLAPGQLH